MAKEMAREDYLRVDMRKYFKAFPMRSVDDYRNQPIGRRLARGVSEGRIHEIGREEWHTVNRRSKEA